ncbi:rubrerythrin [bacterium]|nr:rubrerythrin [bacterium]
MPSFADPFSVLKADKKLTTEELIRCLRIMIAGEYEAIQLYTQLAESIDDPLSKKVLLEIANEERVHAGEFIRLINHLDPTEAEFYKQGAQEVEENMKKLGL